MIYYHIFRQFDIKYQKNYIYFHYKNCFALLFFVGKYHIIYYVVVEYELRRFYIIQILLVFYNILYIFE